MATVSEALGNEAAPHEITLGGRRYRFGLITQRVKSEFERFLSGTAYQAIAEHREIMGPEAYRDSLEGVRREIAAGVYAWNGPVFLAAMGTVRGVAQLLASVSHDVFAGRACTADELLTLVSEHEQELQAIYQVIVEESFPTPEKKTRQPATEQTPATNARRPRRTR